MTKKYKVVFFDWGGVITDDPGDGSITQFLKNIGASDDEVDEIFEIYLSQFMRGRITEKECWEQLRLKYNLTIGGSISDEFRKCNSLRANDRMLDLVEEIKTAGIKTAVFSNVMPITYDDLDQSGFYTRFDEVIASCKMGYAKPDREIYELALKRLNATADQAIFIDDKQRNLDPADKMGFTTILARSPSQIIQDLKSLIY